MKIEKFITYYQNLRKRFPTLKELERRTLKENKIKKELMESNFHEIDWDRGKDKDSND
tara:strand:- start:245 stop:418 length:174 start_codon:yes stop_codon:yes gene_type:complete